MQQIQKIKDVLAQVDNGCIFFTPYIFTSDAEDVEGVLTIAAEDVAAIYKYKQLAEQESKANRSFAVILKSLSLSIYRPYELAQYIDVEGSNVCDMCNGFNIAQGYEWLEAVPLIIDGEVRVGQEGVYWMAVELGMSQHYETAIITWDILDWIREQLQRKANARI